MKYAYYFLTALLCPLFFSCGKDVVYELPDADQYVKVYMIQAVDIPRETSLFMSEQPQSVNYSAYYSGLQAPKDIHLTFKADPTLVAKFNEENQTEYNVMPEGSYSLEATSAVIPKGDCRTPLMKLSINTFGYIETFTDYLLPVVMETDDAPVNSSLSVTYYYITASNAPGQIPRRQVGSGIVAPMELFSYNDVCLLSRTTDGQVRNYPYNTTAETFDAPTVVKTGWTSSTARLIAWGGSNHLMVVNMYQTLISIPAGPTGTAIADLSGYDGVLTGGFDPFNLLVWTSHPIGILGRFAGAGQINLYKTTPSWTALDLSVITANYFAWNNYIILFCYGKDLMGIDANGDLWLHTFNTATNTFSTSPLKKGSGWDMYTHVTPFGTKLVALDSNGDLWEYDFDLRGNWALKAIE